MVLHREYVWLEYYITSPEFLIEDVLSWDESFGLTSFNYSLFSLLTSPFAIQTYIFIESITKMSFLDFILISESSDLLESQQFYIAIMWDLCEIIHVLFYPAQFIFYTAAQDFPSVLFHHSPELVLAFADFVTTYFGNNSYQFLTSLVSNFFSDSVIQKVSVLSYFIGFFCFFVWFSLIIIGALRLMKWSTVLESHSTRLSLYFFSISKDNRLQLEAVLVTVLLFTLLSIFNIFSIRDLYEESIESIMLSFFYIFLSIFLFFLCKNSIHYFAFLEASMSNNQTTGIFVQFGKDAANSFVLCLRFAALMVRLNIYDTVEDLLDTNYVFACEFEDERYCQDILYARFDWAMTEIDCLQHHLSLKPYNQLLNFDSITTYFIICGYYLTIVFFLLEAAGRVLLAFFIVYLIIFEMQSINRSYTEDSFINNERSNN
jgi:hypothetical protein